MHFVIADWEARDCRSKGIPPSGRVYIRMPTQSPRSFSYISGGLLSHRRPSSQATLESRRDCWHLHHPGQPQSLKIGNNPFLQNPTVPGAPDGHQGCSTTPQQHMSPGWAPRHCGTTAGGGQHPPCSPSSSLSPAVLIRSVG